MSRGARAPIRKLRSAGGPHPWQMRAMVQLFAPPDQAALIKQASLYRRLAGVARSRATADKLLALAIRYESQAAA